MLNYENYGNYGYADYETNSQNQNFYQDYRLLRPIEAVAAPEIILPKENQLELEHSPPPNPPPSSQPLPGKPNQIPDQDCRAVRQKVRKV